MDKEKSKCLKELNAVLADFEPLVVIVFAIKPVFLKSQIIKAVNAYRAFVNNLRAFDKKFLKKSMPSAQREKMETMRERLNFFLKKIKERRPEGSLSARTTRIFDSEIRFLLDKGEEGSQASKAS